MQPIDFLERALETRSIQSLPPRAVERSLGTTLAEHLEFLALRWQLQDAEGVDLLALPGLSLPERFRAVLGHRELGLLGQRPGRPQAEAVFAVAGGEIFELEDNDRWGTRAQHANERFKNSLRAASLLPKAAFPIAAGFMEMISNALEHAEAPLAPVATFEVFENHWQFSVTDVGIGVLSSMRRNPEYVALGDGFQALQKALMPGVSGTAKPAGGLGFEQVFRSLANRSADVRFRSADALAEWSGQSPSHHQLRYTPATPRLGFHVAITGKLP